MSAEQIGWISFIAGDGRTVLRFGPGGETEFEDADVPTIVSTFWTALGTCCGIRPRGTALVQRNTVRLQSGAINENPSAAVILHPSGDVTGEHYSPDPRALKMWAAVAAAWPEEP